jgi:hypothetical protein
MMPRPLTFLGLATLGLLALGGCVAYPVDGYHAAPAAVYAPPPTVYFGGSFGGYRPYRGYHPPHHHKWRHRHWR